MIQVMIENTLILRCNKYLEAAVCGLYNTMDLYPNLSFVTGYIGMDLGVIGVLNKRISEAIENKTQNVE